MIRAPYAVLMVLLMVGCTKKEYITEIEHINQNIDDNIAPPYNGVTSIQIDNYINKIYIDLYGREPLDPELESGSIFLKDGELSPDTRDLYLQDIMASAEYYERFWEIYNFAYLQNVTDDYIDFQILILTQAYNDALQNGETLLADRILLEIDRYQKLLDAPTAYANGAIGIEELMRRIANNGVYDEINMGIENFVVACFENFFKRYPTEAELPAAATMVEGFAAQIFTEDGSSKDDFMDIFFGNAEFYQGLVFDIYQQLLSRLPDSAEMGISTQELQTNSDYQAIQRKLIISEEYAGF
ncbi:MAG: hypothetical protein GYB31_18015 [Bacteroidetes bacterium]|nr:hypothetical protein [Bacteroidota bacterium]